MHGFRLDTNNSLIWESNQEIVRIEPWGRDSLRVRASLGPLPSPDHLPGALLAPVPQQPQMEIGPDLARLTNGLIAAEVTSRGRVRFISTATGAELLSELDAPYPAHPGRRFRPVGGDHSRLEVRFKPYDGERFYGLGQQQHGRLDQKGCVIDLLQRNAEVSIPFLLSSRGYGFLWHNPAVGRVELAHNGTRWTAESTRQMDYWITAGDTPAALLEHYADATGHAPLLPEWAAGFWQCKLRYRTQAELLSVAREHVRRGLPLSVIVVDFFHWPAQGDWAFDSQFWPDPAAMVRELADMGVRVMVSIWPTVNALSRNFEALQQRGLLVSTARGVPALMAFQDVHPAGRVYLHYYDATHPEARAFIWEQVRQNYFQHGIKIYWLDACEPELKPDDPDNVQYHLGNGLAMTNLYPLLHQQAFYEGLQAEGETEIVTLCRSAWAGSQRYAAAVWSGDIRSTFESLQAQVRAGLNMGLSGIPWWTTDTGGFAGGDITTPYFRELIVRWFQYSVFCPLLRLHGYREPVEQWVETSTAGVGALGLTGADNEVWSFGDEAYAILREWLMVRERLRPYLMEQMKVAHERGLPPMRPLFFDFPGDEACVAVDDQFMLGPDVLVAPVLHEGERSRQVYLPAGPVWTDAWTGETLPGGQWLTAAAPLERIPVYVRAGASVTLRS